MRISHDSEFASPSFPKWETSSYDKETQVFEVELSNGKKVRYFGVPPETAFLHENSPHRNSDFLQIKDQFRSEPVHENAQGLR